MKKILLTLGLALFTASVVAAQSLPKNNFHNSKIGTYDRVTKGGPYMTGKFFDNTFIGVAGGVNIFQYDVNDSNKPGVGDRMAPALDVYLGKWVTPTLGLRVGYSGMKFKSVIGLVPNADDKLAKWNHQYWHGDVLFNISNAVGGYRENRFWDIVPFVGAGYAISKIDEKGYGNVKHHKLAAQAGLLNEFRLGNRLDLTLEGRWMATDRIYDGIPEGKKFDQMWSALLGVQFKFGAERGFKRPVYQAPVDVKGYETRIATLEGNVARGQSTIDRLTRELDAAKKNVTVEKIAAPVAIATYFGLGQSAVHQSETSNLKAIADIIKANPSRKYNVTGYADAGTGTPAGNKTLSEARAKNVADILVKNGVNRSQLVVTGKGGVAKHPHVPVMDRVVVTE